MTERTRLTTVETVHENRSWLFTAADEHGVDREIVLVPCGEGVAAWVNRCPHEAQRLDTGRGVAMRDGEIVCPRHGSMFESCTGECDNGEAAGSALVPIEVAVEDGTVYLTDEDATFEHEGGLDEGGGPSSTSHLSF